MVQTRCIHAAFCISWKIILYFTAMFIKNPVNPRIMLIMVLPMVFLACEAGNTFTDARDGKTYKTVKIGEQTWMAENLNYKTDRSWCYDDYENDENKCKAYGRLYGWDAAKTACPKGWHLPSKAEWNSLIEAAGGKNVAGKVLKSTSGWEKNGSDILGFSALPGGVRYYDGFFGEAGSNGAGCWWRNDGMHYAAAGNYDSLDEHDDKESGFSIRCVKD
jgi:uncharacterized protein (TIGR02145 family)